MRSSLGSSGNQQPFGPSSSVVCSGGPAVSWTSPYRPPGSAGLGSPPAETVFGLYWSGWVSVFGHVTDPGSSSEVGFQRSLIVPYLLILLFL